MGCLFCCFPSLIVVGLAGESRTKGESGNEERPCVRRGWYAAGDARPLERHGGAHGCTRFCAGPVTTGPYQGRNRSLQRVALRPRKVRASQARAAARVIPVIVTPVVAN